MLNPELINAGDRVLLLGIPEPATIIALASRLTSGLLVAMGREDEVRQARRAMADLDNVMFSLLDEGSIPWRDGFFTCVEDLTGDWPDAERMRREIARVTASPGE